MSLNQILAQPSPQVSNVITPYPAKNLAVNSVQVQASALGLKYSGTITASVDFSVGSPAATLSTSLGFISVTNLADIGAGADASKSIVITNTLVSATSVVLCQVVQATTDAGSCIVVKSATAGAGTVTILLANAGGTTSGATKTCKISLLVLSA
jgi:hypothetical protein